MSFLSFLPHSFIFMFFFFKSSRHPRDLHSFPTRRSSDLLLVHHSPIPVCTMSLAKCGLLGSTRTSCSAAEQEDRKSTRLNSSHVAISYAVFCLKKKNIIVVILISLSSA